MKKPITALAVVAASALVTTATLFTVGSPAQALPSGCVYGYDGQRGGVAYCTSGTGEFRVVVTCRQTPPGQPGGTYTNAGPWRKPGQQYFSRATCGHYDGDDPMLAVGYEVRLTPPPDLPTGPVPTVIG